MIDYVVSFVSRYLYAILFSTVISASALIGIKLTGKRAYKTRMIIFISPLFGSFLVAIWISSLCLAHWLSMNYGESFHIACSDVPFSYIRAICTSWVALMGTSFFLAFICGIANYYLGEKIIKWLYRIKSLGESQAENVHKILSNLSQKACIEVPKLGLIERSTPSVFSIGGRKKSTIVVSVGFLETLSNDEMEASLAHEISHIKNRDNLIKSLAASLKFAAPFNFIGYLIEPAVCRDREFLADEESARLTKKPRALMSALIKLYESSAMVQKNKFFISFPMKLFAPDFKWSIFSRHPPMAERLKRLLDFEKSSHK